MFIWLTDYTINLSSTYFVWGIVLLVIIAIILLWYNIPQRLASGWQDISKLQDKNESLLKQDMGKLQTELDHKNSALEELTREVDIRREINRQDTLKINTLKSDLDKKDETIDTFRKRVQDLTEKLENLKT